jgi:hypothetical protein
MLLVMDAQDISNLLMTKLRSIAEALPDCRRKGGNQKYAMADACLAAFSVFFTQSSSFLEWQRAMHSNLGRDNAGPLFGVGQIPSDAQIRNLLDGINPEVLHPAFLTMGDLLEEHNALDHLRTEFGYLIALDGTDTFASHEISCRCCHHTAKSDGTHLYRHIAVTPCLVAPAATVTIVLPPEFVVPQDGHAKQDCELAASGRWLDKWGERYAAKGAVLLGDDLYCHQPFCLRALATGFEFLFTCKPDSHKELYSWVAEIPVDTLIVKRRYGRDHFTDTYRFANDLPLRDSADALTVGWLELVSTDATGKETYRNAWASSIRVTTENVAALVAAARSRWQIENGCNNVLKTKGYHLEHNFGHGKDGLANFLAMLNLVAFLLHSTLDLLAEDHREVRRLLATRKTFHTHQQTLLQYLAFDNLRHLYRFMLEKLRPPDTS